MSAWPQYLALALLLSILFWHLVSDQEKNTKRDRIISVTASFVVFGTWFGLLWAGNFWAPIGLPSL